MAKGEKMEVKIARELQALGTYQPAFEPAIHDLCVLRREVSRTRKAWKATVPPGVAPSPLDPHYALIRQQERDILALEDALGLTPKGLQRLTGKQAEAPVDPRSEISRRLDALAERCGGYDGL